MPKYKKFGSDHIPHSVCVKFSIALISILSTVSVVPSVHAKQVTICNASPLKVDVAVRLISDTGERKTHGWYNLQPGGCSYWNTQGSKFYYYAQSYEELARWLNDGDPYKWDSWFPSLCVDPKYAFEMSEKGSCQTKYGFKSALLRQDVSTIKLYEKHHKGIKLEDAQNIRRNLIGRMDYENMLRNQEGKESPFQLGIYTEDDIDSVRITRVFPGMPAEAEGLEVNDRIVALNGYKIENERDFIWVLDNISIFRAEPLPMIINRNGQNIDGSIEPLFFPFNHWEYSPDGKAGTFLWAVADGATLGLGNELLCGGLNFLAEGLRSLPEDRDFNGKQAIENSSSCSRSLNKEMAKKQLLYEDAANAGYWASILVPGIPVAKVLKAKGVLPLAARSRHVARKPVRKSFQQASAF